MATALGRSFGSLVPLQFTTFGAGKFIGSADRNQLLSPKPSQRNRRRRWRLVRGRGARNLPRTNRESCELEVALDPRLRMPALVLIRVRSCDRLRLVLRRFLRRGTKSFCLAVL